MIDLSKTIIPKSDQLNADSLIPGPRTITVTAVTVFLGKEQPVFINFEGDDGRPFKPCLSMRKVLAAAWGCDGAKYVGKSMTIYLDRTVTWGGEEVGGIRISHLSGIEKRMRLALSATKKSRKVFIVDPLPNGEMPAKQQAPAAFIPDEPAQAWLTDISEAGNLDDLKTVFSAAWKSTQNATDRASFKAGYDARAAALNATKEAS